jgi:hypothetical protein
LRVFRFLDDRCRPNAEHRSRARCDSVDSGPYSDASSDGDHRTAVGRRRRPLAAPASTHIGKTSNNGDATQANGGGGDQHRRRRRRALLHNVFERQRREALLAAFCALRAVVPDLRSHARRASKALILIRSLSHIQRLEAIGRRMDEQLRRLVEERGGLERRIMDAMRESA